MFQQGIADQGDEKDADGEDEAAPAAIALIGGAAGKEAIFRAPGPVHIDSTLKRNIPQAQAMSASTMSERITPEFQAQANYIIEMIQKRAELKDGDGDAEVIGGSAGKGDPLLDPSDRVHGYRKYRRWVDDGLDIWKVSRGLPPRWQLILLAFTARARRALFPHLCSYLFGSHELWLHKVCAELFRRQQSASHPVSLARDLSSIWNHSPFSPRHESFLSAAQVGHDKE